MRIFLSGSGFMFKDLAYAVCLHGTEAYLKEANGESAFSTK